MPASADVRVSHTRHSLRDTPSTFTRSSNAAQTQFALVSQTSTFGAKTAETSVFRAAEVAPHRLHQTQSLLTQLNARQDKGAILIDLPADILFDFDKATLRPAARTELAKATELLKSYHDASVLVEGHTDAKGANDYNQKLSERRAQSVASALEASVGRRPTTVGVGETKPLASNVRPDGSDDPAGRQKNRRVTIIIQPLGS